MTSSSLQLWDPVLMIPKVCACSRVKTCMAGVQVQRLTVEAVQLLTSYRQASEQVCCKASRSVCRLCLLLPGCCVIPCIMQLLQQPLSEPGVFVMLTAVRPSLHGPDPKSVRMLTPLWPRTDMSG